MLEQVIDLVQLSPERTSAIADLVTALATVALLLVARTELRHVIDGLNASKAAHEAEVEEMRRQHSEQMSLQARPLIQVERVQWDHRDRTAPIAVTVTNIGLGPARGITLRMWFAALPAPVNETAFRTLRATITANRSAYPFGWSWVGGLRSQGGERTVELVNPTTTITPLPVDWQVVAYWEATCGDAYEKTHDFSQIVDVRDATGAVIVGAAEPTLRSRDGAVD